MNNINRRVNYVFFARIDWRQRLELLLKLGLIEPQDDKRLGVGFLNLLRIGFNRSFETGQNRALWDELQKMIPLEDREPYPVQDDPPIKIEKEKPMFELVATNVTMATAAPGFDKTPEIFRRHFKSIDGPKGAKQYAQTYYDGLCDTPKPIKWHGNASDEDGLSSGDLGTVMFSIKELKTED